MGRKNKVCDRCGRETDSFSYGGYCEICADEIWDSGFESTTQHAEEIYEQQLRWKEEVNRELNKEKINYKQVAELLQFRSGTLKCSKCGYVRIDSKSFYSFKNINELIETLKNPCKKCNANDFYIFE